MKRSVARAADLCARGLLLAAIVVSPQLLGGVNSWSTVVICVFSLLALLSVLWVTRRSDAKKRTRGSWVVLAMIAALVWTAVQALPLPCSIVQVLAPKSVEQMRLTLDALGQENLYWCAMSRDPGNTELEIIKGLAIVAVFCAAWLFAVFGNRKFIVACVVWSTIAMAIVSLGHQLFLAERVFGLYAPLHATVPVYGPLMNPNSLAGFLIMGFPLVLAFGVESERAKRITWYALAILVGTVTIATLSRGGIAVFLGSALLFGFMLAARKTSRRRNQRLMLFVGASIASSAGYGLYLFLEQVLAEFGSKNFSKLDLVAQSLTWSGGQPLWLGVGRGAFSVSFVEFLGTTRRFTHPENLIVQWISEWGLPITAMLLSVLVVVVIQRMLETRSITTLAALVGIATIAVQNLLDFGLELTGIAIVASALLAAGVAPSARNRRYKKKEVQAILRLPLYKLSIAVFAAGLVALISLSSRVLATDKRAIESRFKRIAQTTDRKAFRETLGRALTAHPSEPNFTLMAGAEAVHYRDPRALKLLNRTMQLARNWPHPHILAARWLFENGHLLQAFLEIREAEIRSPRSTGKILCRILNKEPNARFLLRAAPSGPERIDFLEMAASCVDYRSELAKAIDHQLLKTNRSLPNPRIREARRLHQVGKTDGAIAVLRAVIRQHPEFQNAYFALAEILMATGKPEEVLSLLRTAERNIEDKRRLLSMRARAETSMGDERAMRVSVQKLRELATSDLRSLAGTMTLLGRLENQLGNKGRALKAFEEANRINPTTQSLANVASIAEQLGEKRRAFDAYSKLCQLDPANEGYCKALERLAPPRDLLEKMKRSIP